mmetsp:Transcript_27332/g.41083  ORF Transcript_27332/g.41083 Transcript_27332/m.41083 type:complete len:165 (+) Transcript_27332:331-825(+)
MVVNKGSCFWQINFAEEEKVSKTSPLFALPLPFFSLVGLADTEGLGVGGLVGGDGGPLPLLFPAFPATDGFKLGSDEGWLDIEGTLLGSVEGALEPDGFNDGVDDGSPDTDGFKLGSDEGFEVGDGVLVPSEMEITAVPGAVEISIELTVIVTVFPVPPKFEIA